MNQLWQQRKAVQEFREAIAAIKDESPDEPEANEPLQFLQQVLSAEKSQADRAERLKQAEAAIAHPVCVTNSPDYLTGDTHLVN